MVDRTILLTHVICFSIFRFHCIFYSFILQDANLKVLHNQSLFGEKMEIGLALVENISLTGMVRGYSSRLSTQQVLEKYTFRHYEYSRIDH